MRKIWCKIPPSGQRGLTTLTSLYTRGLTGSIFTIIELEKQSNLQSNGKRGLNNSQLKRSSALTGKLMTKQSQSQAEYMISLWVEISITTPGTAKALDITSLTRASLQRKLGPRQGTQLTTPTLEEELARNTLAAFKSKTTIGKPWVLFRGWLTPGTKLTNRWTCTKSRSMCQNTTEGCIEIGKQIAIRIYFSN